MTTTPESGEPRFVVVPAPGCYGDRATVLSSHTTLDAARRAAAGRRWVVRRGSLPAGSTWLRVYEQTHPIARKES